MKPPSVHLTPFEAGWLITRTANLEDALTRFHTDEVAENKSPVSNAKPQGGGVFAGVGSFLIVAG